jgi:hypothetical protein
MNSQIEIKKNLLIGCSGSVASVKLVEIIEKLNPKFNISNYAFKGRNNTN